VTALVRSEWLKVRTVRSWWGYLAVIVLLTGIAVAGNIGSSNERDTLSFQLGLVDTVGIAVLLAIILGITIVTSEFRHGTITPTFLVAPHRERVIAAKAITSSAVAIGFVVLALVIVAAVALTWFAFADVTSRLGDSEIWTRAAQQVLAAVLWALLGVAIGTLVHSQVAALVGTLVWIFLGETLLVGFFHLLDIEGAVSYLPFRALDAADGTGGEDLLAYWPGVGVTLGWIALVGAAGIVRTLRRDIT
jgi:ABC-2 type transport system permease protein